MTRHDRRALLVNLFLFGTSVVIGITAVAAGVATPSEAVLLTVLSSIFLFLISLLIELRVLPNKMRDMRKELTVAAAAAHHNSTLQLVFDEIIREFRSHVTSLSQGKYTDDRGSIPTMSIKTVESIARSAFVTHVESRSSGLYRDAQGQQYLDAWYKKAAQLQTDAMIRLFIVRDRQDVREDIQELIEQHVQHNASVKVISEAEASACAEGCELDFGLFDEQCVMVVSERPGQSSTRLDVVVSGVGEGVHEAMLGQYQLFRERLLVRAMVREKYIAELIRPMNADFYDEWYLTQTAELQPPHGMSTTDAKTVVAALEERLRGRQGLRVAILGLTPQLVDAVANLPGLDTITLIDQTEVPLPDSHANISSVQENWLEHVSEEKYDAIVADEALNNLRLSQYSRFFRAIYNNLHPHGILVMRTLGRYSPNTHVARAAPSDLLEALKSLGTAPRRSDRAAVVICYLHSAAIAFDEQLSLVDTRRFNKVIRDWVERGKITESEASELWLPWEHGARLRLTSPDVSTLTRISGRYFKLLPLASVDSTYCGPNGILGNNYRITSFRPRREPKV